MTLPPSISLVHLVTSGLGNLTFRASINTFGILLRSSRSLAFSRALETVATRTNPASTAAASPPATHLGRSAIMGPSTALIRLPAATGPAPGLDLPPRPRAILACRHKPAIRRGYSPAYLRDARWRQRPAALLPPIVSARNTPGTHRCDACPGASVRSAVGLDQPSSSLLKVPSTNPNGNSLFRMPMSL